MAQSDGQAQNLTGILGEQLASELIPSATLAPVRNKGFDLVGINGDRFEVKCSRYLPRLNGWRFRVKTAQIKVCDWLLLLALSPDDLLVSYWMIPGNEIRTKQIIINELNLNDYQQYLIEVLPMNNNHDQKMKDKEYWKSYYLKNRERLLAKNSAWARAHPKPPKTSKPTPEGKACTQCGEYKLMAEYGIKRLGRYHKDWQCKTCRRTANNKWREENKDRRNADARARWQAKHPIAKRKRQTGSN